MSYSAALVFSRVRRIATLVLPVALALPGLAGAADCSVTTATLNLGTYDPLSPLVLNPTGTMRINCRRTAVVAETVAVSVQLMPSAPGAFGARRITSGASELSFDVFTDLLHTRVWGDGTGTTFPITGLLVLTALSTSADLDLSIFSRVPARQPVSTGTHNGLFTITVNF